MTWLLEVFGQAWVEAGFWSRKIHLVLANVGFRGPGLPFGWTDRLRAYAFRVTAPLPPSIRELPPGDTVELVAPPTPQTLPETPSSVRDACVAGEPDAILAWADALNAAGDMASADLFRWLQRFAATLAGTGSFWVFADASRCWWGCKESGTEPGDIGEEGTRLAQLLAGWNVYHPAVEWLFRQLDLTRVQVRGSYFADGNKGKTFKIDLAKQHLTPLDPTMGVTNVQAATGRRTRRRSDD